MRIYFIGIHESSISAALKHHFFLRILRLFDTRLRILRQESAVPIGKMFKKKPVQKVQVFADTEHPKQSRCLRY